MDDPSLYEKAKPTYSEPVLSFGGFDAGSDSSSESPESDVELVSKPKDSLAASRRALVNQSQTAHLQKNLVSALLELRVLLQAPIDSVSKLPTENYNALMSLSQSKDPNASLLQHEVESECLSLLRDFQETFSILDDTFSPDQSAVSTEEVWSSIEPILECQAQQRSSTLSYWHARAKVSSVDPQLKSLDQNPENLVKSQVDHSLDRYVKKSRVNRTGAVRLGDCQAERERHDLYDDGDFFYTVLRDLNLADDIGKKQQLLAKHSKRDKLKKAPSERNCKNKRLKYSAIPKLQNFMAPRPQPFPAMAPALFNSLFS
ncbi:hypothetical protein P9112_004020 [Eukaryota sp. TZLM1-RC]